LFLNNFLIETLASNHNSKMHRYWEFQSTILIRPLRSNCQRSN